MYPSHNQPAIPKNSKSVLLAAVPGLQLWKTGEACQATVNLGGNRAFDRFPQELVKNQPGFGQAHFFSLNQHRLILQRQ
jgi:hypothetical protein